MSAKLVLFTFFLVISSSFAGEASPQRLEIIYESYRGFPYFGRHVRTVFDTQTALLQFAEGFLDGVGSAPVFDQIKSCIADSGNAIGDIAEAVADIKSKDPTKVKAGIALLGQAAQIIPDAVQACKGSEDDIKVLVQLVESFKSPASFLYYIGKSLVINHVEVINEVESAVSAYDAQNYNQLGYWVGKAMDTILLNQETASADVDVLNFALGFFEGIGNNAEFANVKACISDAGSFSIDIVDGVEDIRTKDPSKVKEGIQLLGQAAGLIPNAAKACGAAEADIKNLVKMVESFTNPLSFLYYIGKSLLINHVEVINEIENAVTAYDAKNFTSLGFWVGSAMDTIVLGNPEVADTQTDVFNFVEGFLGGIGNAAAFANVKACIVTSDDIVTDLAKGIEDIETKNAANVKAGVQLLGQAAKIIPNAVQECKAGEVDLKNLLKMVESFSSPLSFLYYVGKSLIINHVEVINEVINAINAYQAQNFTGLGYWVGSAMSTVVLGEDQVLNQDFADFLNTVNDWKAAVPEKFEGLTLGEISTKFLGAEKVDLSKYDVDVFNYEGVTDVPSYFNSSQEWPGCIHAIRDQGQCGSCWAFAASEVLSDRLCIASNGTVNVVLSPQDLISCNDVLNHGCNGGNLLFSWWFMQSDGIVTDSCLPYQSANGTNPVACKDFTKCADGTPLKRYFGKGAASLPNPASIQASILQYGPVEAGMTVYQDFMYYTGGVYVHTSGSELGGHAVKITGWGNENGQDYWIVANSWGPTWGEAGFFRIAWGQCGIDSGVVTGQADLSKSLSYEPRFW